MTFIEFAENVLSLKLLDWQKVVLEKAQECKDNGESFYINTYAREGKALLNNIYQQKLGYDRGFEDGSREFAEWLCASYIVSDIIGARKWTENLLAEYERSKK